ncbi:MAG: Fe-S cluster assembly protein SufD [Ignavibacteriaceae bacterium]|nr:Fe-S cluster assembly protein SufD [Ignavibacteriaceae bacterium]
MDKHKELKELFNKGFTSLENRLNGGTKGELHTYRKDALKRFNELRFPTIKDEEWKYTNISPVIAKYFKPSADSAVIADAKGVDRFFINRNDFIHLVFVNGRFSDELSFGWKETEGFTVTNLKTAIKDKPEIVSGYIGKNAVIEDNIFTALSSAFIEDGTFIYVNKNTVVEKPVHIFYVTNSNEEIMNAPRNLFIAGANSQIKVIESYEALSSAAYFTNVVTEIFLEEGAVVEHIKIQDEALGAYHIARTEVSQKKASNYLSYNVDFGGSIVRNNLHTRFDESGAENNLRGLYLTSGSQLVDNHTRIDHAMPHCLSHELYKGVLNDSSRAVFNGKVMVRKDAQKTNAFQENKNLLLSEDALVNTKPQLEIFADDVKCTHGATVGQLSKDSLFYLKSRGFSHDTAMRVLIYAFASDVVHAIDIPEIRDYLEKKIAEKLATGLEN